VAAAVRPTRRDRPADIGGDRAALERPRARLTTAAAAGRPRDRSRRRRRSEVAARHTAGATASRTRGDASRLATTRRCRRTRSYSPAATANQLTSAVSGAAAGPRRRAGWARGRRLSHAAPHMRVAADRFRFERPTPPAVDGTPLASLHARDLRPPARRRPRARARPPPRSCAACGGAPGCGGGPRRRAPCEAQGPTIGVVLAQPPRFDGAQPIGRRPCFPRRARSGTAKTADARVSSNPGVCRATRETLVPVTTSQVPGRGVGVRAHARR
jgi:hypothetical protein